MNYITKRFITYIGRVTLGEVAQKNNNGAAWVESIQKTAEEEEQTDPRIKKVIIKGAKAHKSHQDPNDIEEVITLQFLNEQEQRIKSMHVHEDGSSTEKQKR